MPVDASKTGPYRSDLHRRSAKPHRLQSLVRRFVES